MRPAFRSGRLRKWPYVIDCNHAVFNIIKLKVFSFGLNTINKLGPLIRSEVRMRNLFRTERGSGSGLFSGRIRFHFRSEAGRFGSLAVVSDKRV